jgi:hypothetical protein
MKIEKTQKPQPIKKSIEVSESLVVDVVREGDEFRVEKDGVVVSRVSGVFRDVCFFVDDYKLCFNRDELVDLFKG